jgi:hypothetical protein
MKPSFTPAKKSKVIPKAPPPVEPEEPEVDLSKIPLVTTALDDEVLIDLCKELLAEAETTKRRVDIDTARLTEIRGELGVFADSYSLPGMKWGNISFSYTGLRSNRRLDKGLLIENGVSPELIALSYKDSKPFIDSRFILPKKPKT